MLFLLLTSVAFAAQQKDSCADVTVPIATSSDTNGGEFYCSDVYQYLEGRGVNGDGCTETMYYFRWGYAPLQSADWDIHTTTYPELCPVTFKDLCQTCATGQVSSTGTSPPPSPVPYTETSEANYCTDDCAYAFGRCVNMIPEDSYNECVKELNDGTNYQMEHAGCVKGCTLTGEMTKWSENQPCLAYMIIDNNGTESARKSCVFPFIYQAGNTASTLPGRRCQASTETRGWCYTNQASTEWGYCDSNCFIEGYADDSFITPPDSSSSEYLILLALSICFTVLF